MLRPRIIPCLLVHEGGLVKTQNFKDPKYVGDPINAVKIFNEKEADELIILDIDATAVATEPDYKLIADVAAECRMPLCYGGGIRTPEQAKKIIRLGVEKVAISSAAVTDPGLLTRIAEEIGRQSVVVVLDVRRKRGLFKSGYEVYTNNGSRLVKTEFEVLVKQLEAAGAGEIVVNSIDCDGKMQGYDLELGRQLRKLVSIPISILGGAGSLEDIKSLIGECGIVGAVAGSLFVFKGQYRAVLINYPNTVQKDAICSAV